MKILTEAEIIAVTVLLRDGDTVLANALHTIRELRAALRTNVTRRHVEQHGAFGGSFEQCPVITCSDASRALGEETP